MLTKQMQVSKSKMVTDIQTAVNMHEPNHSPSTLDILAEISKEQEVHTIIMRRMAFITLICLVSVARYDICNYSQKTYHRDARCLLIEHCSFESEQDTQARLKAMHERCYFTNCRYCVIGKAATETSDAVSRWNVDKSGYTQTFVIASEVKAENIIIDGKTARISHTEWLSATLCNVAEIVRFKEMRHRIGFTIDRRHRGAQLKCCIWKQCSCDYNL